MFWLFITIILSDIDVIVLGSVVVVFWQVFMVIFFFV